MDASEMGSKGGKSRAKKMTKEERKASARNAVNARWDAYRAAKAEAEKEAGAVVKKAVKKAGKGKTNG